MYKILILILFLTSCIADFNVENSNYIKTGISKDRFDHRYYNYVEAGKTVPVSKNSFVNSYVGLQNGGDLTVVNPDKDVENYWEFNYEYRW